MTHQSSASIVPSSNHSSTHSSNHSSATVAASERVFALRDHASLWFSLGVGLLVMQMGAYLIPALGTRAALLAIIIGSVLGSALLAWVAQLGCNHGLSSAGLMQATYGRAFAKLPVVLNIVQLLGWTAFELVVMRDGFSAIVTQTTGIQAAWLPYAMTVFFGGLLFLLASSSMIRLVRKFIGRFGLPLVVLSLVWLTVQFALRVQHGEGGIGGFSAFWHKTGTGEMSTLAAIDLVIAMPVSWLPLVADYARYGVLDGKKSAFKGTWAGYAIANIWCYGLGVLVVSVAAPDANLVSTLLLAQFGLIALGLILVDEMDNAYGDVHSGAVSLNHLFSRTTVITWGKWLAIASVLAAMLLNMHGLESFLLLLSSIFVPLYGVIVARLSFKSSLAEQNPASVHWVSALIWFVGIAVFHLCAQLAPQYGSAIPSLIVTLGLGMLVRRVD